MEHSETVGDDLKNDREEENAVKKMKKSAKRRRSNLEMSLSRETRTPARMEMQEKSLTLIPSPRLASRSAEMHRTQKTSSNLIVRAETYNPETSRGNLATKY